MVFLDETCFDIAGYERWTLADTLEELNVCDWARNLVFLQRGAEFQYGRFAGRPSYYQFRNHRIVVGGEFVASDEARVNTYCVSCWRRLQMGQSSRVRNEVPIKFSSC